MDPHGSQFACLSRQQVRQPAHACNPDAWRLPHTSPDMCTSKPVRPAPMPCGRSCGHSRSAMCRIALRICGL
eukprot:10807498-Lingulodinium_polyedra.AAC.1